MSSRTPSYRLHKGSGQAVVTLSGRDHYLGRFGSTESKVEYDRLVAEWLHNGRQIAVGADLTVTELVRDYMKYASGYYRKDGMETSEISYLRGAMAPLLKLYGDTLAADFRPGSLKTVRDAIIASGACRNVVNGRIYRIVRVFKWGVECERVPANVHHALATVGGLKKGRSPARESEPVKPVPETFVNAIEPHVARQIWAMISLQRLTGARPGEICIMRTIDIDTSGKVWVYTPSGHKTEHHGKGRQVYIGPAAQEVLRPWLKSDLTAYLFSPIEAMAERAQKRRRNSTSPDRRKRRVRTPQKAPGGCYTTNSYRHAIGVACRAAFPHPTLGTIAKEDLTPEQRAELKAYIPVETWSPNQLRHNAATRLRREYGIDMAQIILGHSDVNMTAVYAEADREKAIRIMSEVG